MTYSLQAKRDFARDMRELPTEAEAALWELLRADQLGCRFRRQILVYGFIVDFWCPSLRLAIEVDGSAHQIEEVAARDAEKERALTKRRIGLLRFENDDVLTAPTVVLHRIMAECALRKREKSAFKGVGFDLRGTQRIDSSSSRPAGNVDAAPKVNPLSALPPPEQRITEADLCALQRKIVTLTRQRSMNFGDDFNRPVAEKIWEQKFRLGEFQAKKKRQA